MCGIFIIVILLFILLALDIYKRVKSSQSSTYERTVIGAEDNPSPRDLVSLNHKVSRSHQVII